MNLNLVHLDDALLGQPAFLEACGGLGAVQIDVRCSGPDLRLWATHDDYAALTDKLREKLSGLESTWPLVTWLGSGDFHHVSAALVKLRAEALGKPLTIIHFDNHPDWVSFAGGLHCGSWVRYVLETGAVDRVISLGLTSRDLAWPEFKGAALDLVASGHLVVFPLAPPATVVISNYGRGAAHAQDGRRIEWQRFETDAQSKAAQRILDLVETDSIYVTIDKDVLGSDNAKTNWDQGALTIDSLVGWIEVLSKAKSIAGLDIVGDYSKPAYGNGFAAATWKRAEALVDQPRQLNSLTLAGNVNQATNLKLLKVLEAALC